MKNLFIFAFLICTSFLYTQNKNSNELKLNEKRVIKKDTLESNEEKNHQSFSLGGGLFYVNDNGAKILPVISFSTTFQFSRKTLLEIKYDNCPSKYNETDRFHTYIYSLILQTCFDLNNKKWKLYTGIGFGIASVNHFSVYFPTGNAKIEYNFNKWFSINSEFMLITFWSGVKNGSNTYPVMLKLNSNFKLPY
jgi:hypothetical protein